MGKKKMRRGGPRGNTEREREREGKAVFLEGRSGLIFRILFGRGGFLLIEVYPQGRKSEGFYEASLLWIYFERGGTRER